jgi:hypothetical protein
VEKTETYSCAQKPQTSSTRVQPAEPGIALLHTGRHEQIVKYSFDMKPFHSLIPRDPVHYSSHGLPVSNQVVKAKLYESKNRIAAGD